MAGVTVDKEKGGFASVVARFPEKKEALERLFQSNQSFHPLCDEYEACMKALKYWRESSLAEAPEFRKEFLSLLSELEDEILELLNKEVRD